MNQFQDMALYHLKAFGEFDAVVRECITSGGEVYAQ
jgi:hypothetical protein